MDDKRLREAIEASAEQRVVSANLLYCCIAALNNKINTSNKQQYVYKRNRDTLARIALYELGIDKVTLANAIVKLSDGCYPTLKAVNRVMAMLSKGYTIDNSFIPDNLLKYKSDKEIAPITELNQAPRREEHYVICDNTFVTICSSIEAEYNIELDNTLQYEVVKISDGYSFETVLKAFQWHKKSINDSIYGKTFNSSHHKCKYILACIKKWLPDTDKQIKEQERAHNAAMEAVGRAMNNWTAASAGAEYTTKTKPLSEKQKKLFEDLW